MPGDLIVVLAGKGHNGDDARASVQHLTDREVRLVNVTQPELAREEISFLLNRRPKLLVDGLFGIGLDRTLATDWIQLLEEINKTAVRILSVDVPSGLNAETGKPEGAALRAAITLTLGAPKRGLLEHEAGPFVGRLEVAPDIGLVECPRKGELLYTLETDFDKFPPARLVHGHKGTFGHLLVIGGSLGYHGAAVLATHGGLCACPGLVTLLTSENVYLPVASQLQAAMVFPWKTDFNPPVSVSAILAGPGLAAGDLSPELKNAVRRLWVDSVFPVIVDASALTWLAPPSASCNALRVITPHPGEAARMLGTSTNAVQADRPKALRELSQRLGGCWVVLKGHQTLVGRSQGEIYVNSSGNPVLAQGGSGDVLGGFLSGLLAQPFCSANPELTLRYGVWQHGATADRLVEHQGFFTIEDLLCNLRPSVASSHFGSDQSNGQRN
jgi:NAD(P)H-hydrate epimerase